MKILLIEDEPGIAFSIETDLQTEGYEVEVVDDGAKAIPRALAESFDLILLDVMLPNMDGFEICRQLRHQGLKTPVILLTAKTHEAEKILGLDMGADDYVTKPFSPRELRARIRSVLRRATEPTADHGAASKGDDVHRFGIYELDMTRFELRSHLFGVCAIVDVSPCIDKQSQHLNVRVSGRNVHAANLDWRMLADQRRLFLQHCLNESEAVEGNCGYEVHRCTHRQ
jgi:DNA-binding response OmpR family regulator